VLQLNTGLGSVVSTVANNTQDPNAAMTGWAGWSGPAFNSATTFTATGTAPAYVLTPTSALSALALGASYVVLFTSAGTTGSNTLNVSGLGAKSLMQYDLNGNLVPAVITSGLIAACQYNGTYWVVLDALPSSTISSTQQTLVANEGAAATPVALYKSGVLTTLKNAISFSFTGANTLSAIQGNLTSWLNTATLPANFWVPGKTVRITAYLSITVTTAGNLTFTVLVAGQGNISITVPVTVAPWVLRLDALITCQSVGGSGTAILSEAACASGSTAGIAAGNIYSSVKVTSGESTLVPNALDVTVQASTTVGSANILNALIEVLG
jgi:hypothetical protein